jgi:hypothetical protein
MAAEGSQTAGRWYDDGSMSTVLAPTPPSIDLASFVPKEVGPITDHQTDLPRIARDSRLTARIDAKLREIPTVHHLFCDDARHLDFLEPDSVQLVVTSPPYWTLKQYRDSEGQLGHVETYDEFLGELDKVWRHCWRALVPGGRLIVVVGDVCLSRRKNGGRHMVVPLHASIQEWDSTIWRRSSGTRSRTLFTKSRTARAGSLGSRMNRMPSSRTISSSF